MEINFFLNLQIEKKTSNFCNFLGNLKIEKNIEISNLRI